MRTKKITIVGVGALGSHVLFLARNWPVQIKVIDFDRVEQKNTQAQMHTRMSLGKNKAQAIQQAMQGMYGLKIEAVPHKLSSQNVEQLLRDSDLVLDCTDNIAARQVIQNYIRNAATYPELPCLHGSLSAAGDFARVVWTEHFKPDAEGTEGAATCENGVQLPFFALAAAYMAQEAQRFLREGTKRSLMITPTSVQRLA
jgi:molybdopterin/thiamine biosynthesis adenylyltransferase